MPSSTQYDLQPGTASQAKQSKERMRSSARPISTGQLKGLPLLHLRPINVVVYHGPNTAYGSRRTLGRGDLISEGASCLDAFSAYPFRT